MTQKLLKKKPRKGSKNAKPITKTENCESFFNFFNPPQVPEDEEDIDEDVVSFFYMKNTYQHPFNNDIGLLFYFFHNVLTG